MVDGVTQMLIHRGEGVDVDRALVLIAVMYLLRCAGVWRVLLFGASTSWRLSLREDFYRQRSRQHPASYLRYRTGRSLSPAPPMTWDRVVFAAGEGVLTLVDS